jgi:hypothetical protein
MGFLHLAYLDGPARKASRVKEASVNVTLQPIKGGKNRFGSLRSQWILEHKVHWEAMARWTARSSGSL